MSDLLVKLYKLPDARETLDELRAEGIEIKRAIAPEKHLVLNWVGENFSAGWESECGVAFARLPCSCFVAVKDTKVVGFACYDAAALGFFGPIGVDESARKSGVGKGLLIRTLEAMREAGYGYAIVGWAGPIDFFKKTVDAAVIPDSEPGVYRNIIKG
ncbi:MAG: GNAT family N-acetyltransferase [Elusimicrobia bacterium RIFOXYA12_FULL_51_18]|nr:MAG: GNAT family N-acetyltransferase [Elusimicrobia bacterium RIFOXYA12_FULL_51_18]OGS30606.1 MAG: GNAT family N-acetyltransferase [Elusimicrobia bacterium RIFOXYA2_FULL_53_38]